MTSYVHQLQTVLVLTILFGKAFSQSACYGWTPYKDEKCILLFTSPGVMNYVKAATYCFGKAADLLTIETGDKQAFVTNYFQSRNVSDNVWLGLKYYENSNYLWRNGNKLKFSNWKAENLKNDASNCVQFHTEKAEFGKWSEVNCSRQNLVACERIQPWSSSKIKTVITNLAVNSAVPLGFIYVQLPNQMPPTNIWPSLRWQDVTKEYAGLFFRAEGGDSASFGQLQVENSPRLVNVKNNYNARNNNYYKPGQFLSSAALHSGKEVGYIKSGDSNVGKSNAQIGLSFRMSGGEVRPRNTAIRIWKRV